MAIIFKNTEIRLFSNADDMYSHRVNIALNIKDIAAETVVIDPTQLHEEFLEVNPYASSPTLVDRDLIIYNSNIILSYLDERFPHPPLLPVEPIERTKLRLQIYRVEQDWVRLATLIQTSASEERIEKARKLLTDNLIAYSPSFSEYEFFGSESVSLLDCIAVPLLWRLDSLGIHLSAQQAPDLLRYMQRMFDLDVVKNVHDDIAAIEKEKD